jgi:1,2-phenylacetyl-CoA epoxidase PaaB subunit
MPKYKVQYARIEHQVYFLEVHADDEEHAKQVARNEFTGDEDFKVVHAEEFVLQVDDAEDEHHPDCLAFDNFGCRCEELNKEAA